MEEKKIQFQVKTIKMLAYSIGSLVLILLVFKVGTVVGAKRADFSCRWSDNYHQNFGGPKKGFMEGFGDRDFIEANGVFGQVIKIESNQLVIKDGGNIEKVVIVSESTVINKFKETIKISDLKVDDRVVIIGSPNSSGQIEAKLIRLMPTPPNFLMAPVNSRGQI